MDSSKLKVVEERARVLATQLSEHAKLIKKQIQLQLELGISSVRAGVNELKNLFDNAEEKQKKAAVVAGAIVVAAVMFAAFSRGNLERKKDEKCDGNSTSDLSSLSWAASPTVTSPVRTSEHSQKSITVSAPGKILVVGGYNSFIFFTIIVLNYSIRQ